MFSPIRNPITWMPPVPIGRRESLRAMSLHRCVVIFALLASGHAPCFAEDLLTWDVNQNTISVGSGVATAAVLGISGSTLKGGGGQGVVNSPSTTWNRTFSPATTSFSAAQAAGHYFSFTTTVGAGYTVRISGITGLNLAITSNGPSSAGLFYSTDGGSNYVKTGSTFTVSTTLTSAGDAFGSTMALDPIEIIGGASGTTVDWRLVVTGGSGGRLGIGNANAFDFALTQTTSGRLTVKTANTGTTPDIVGYNMGSFPTVNNTRDWWRYSGSNGARVFLSPEETELNDDIPATGDGVTDEASFLARRDALRADPLNKNYINWDYFERRYSYGWDTTFGNMRQAKADILVQITAGRFPINETDDWARKWELWQHYYVQAFYLGKNFDVTRYQMFNEPDHPNANGITPSNWFLRLRLAADALQCGMADMNALYGKSLVPNIYAPVTAGGTGSYADWGARAINNRHKNFLGVSDPDYLAVNFYAYHQYNSDPASYGSTMSGIRSLMSADMAPEKSFPISVTEFNVHSGSFFDTFPETLDHSSKYPRLGAIVANLAKNSAKELYLFKFPQTSLSGTYGVAKNGMFYRQNDSSPNHYGGATKAAEVYRLFAKANAPGGVLKNFTLASNGSLDQLDVVVSRNLATGTYYVFSVNNNSSGASMVLDTAAWGIPAGSRYLLEEVSETSYGAGRKWDTVSVDGTLSDGSGNQIFQPARSVWLFTIPSKLLQAPQIVAASDDSTVKDGTNGETNYGSSTTLIARNDPSNVSARSAALIKFQMPLIYPPDIQLAVLSMRARTTTSNATVQSHIYGLSDDAWTENVVSWSNAPNLTKGAAAGNLIGDRVITGQGDSTFIQGQLVASSTSHSEKLIDVTDFLRQQADGKASFLITQDPRWDVALPSLEIGDTQADGIEIQATEGSSANHPGPQLKLVRLKDSDGDGISDDAEITVFFTLSNVADTDGDGVSDGVEILVNGTDPLNWQPAVTITSPAEGGQFAYGKAIPFTVDVQAVGNNPVITSVAFFDGETLLGTDTNTTAPYETSITPGGGWHFLKAIATDSNGIIGTSGIVRIDVSNPPSPVDLLRWNITENTIAAGSGIATPALTGVSGSVLIGGGSQGSSSSPSNTWNRAFTTTANFDAAQEAGNFFRFTTTAAAGFSVRIHGITGLSLSRTDTGPASAGLFYSTDGGTTFTQTGSTFNVGTAQASAATAFASTMSSTPILMGEGTTIHWRLVVFGTGGRLGIGKVTGSDFTLMGASIPNHYAAWATVNGISGQAASADFDKDGIANLVEYALALNPTAASGQPGTFSGGILSFSKGEVANANGDATYQIEQSADLAGWIPVTPTVNDANTISFALPPGETRKFLRLRITLAP
jgi:hypothetical protein